MNGWFIALLVIYSLDLGFVLSKHGKNREGKYSFWTSLISALLLIFLIYKAIVAGF